LEVFENYVFLKFSGFLTLSGTPCIRNILKHQIKAEIKPNKNNFKYFYKVCGLKIRVKLRIDLEIL
jgi:hypothetical protein